MKAADTSDQALAVQTAMLKGMTGPERLRIAFELSETVRSLCEARLRRQYPDMSVDQFIRRFTFCVLPPEEIPPVLR